MPACCRSADSTAPTTRPAKPGPRSGIPAAIHRMARCIACRPCRLRSPASRRNCSGMWVALRVARLRPPGPALSMTDCWINIMPRGVTHGLHLHPLSTLSGTYYVRTPKGAPGLKLEDPRLDRFMAAPPRKDGVSPGEQTVGHDARCGGHGRDVRKLVATRGAREYGQLGAHQHQLQFQLVLRNHRPDLSSWRAACRRRHVPGASA